MKNDDIEDIEISLLLEAIYRRYGHDFRQYAKASIARRIKKTLSHSGAAHISDLIPKIIHSREFWDDMVLNFSINTSDMFRDPLFFKSLKENVFPLLKTYPSLKIWHAGCSTGEEVYSLAILLKESGLYERSTIFATDFNDPILEMAKTGIYTIGRAKEWSENYVKSGGKKSLSEYYVADDAHIKMASSLKKKITFANHNLVSDGSFGEMNLILCRNVLIYFEKVLQNRVYNLFYDSSVNGGILCLGSRESIRFSEFDNKFIPIDKKWKIFKKHIS